MNTLFHLIFSFDAGIYHWLSQFHGNWFLDHLIAQIEANTLLKTGLFIAGYCYFWFYEGRDQQERRKSILMIFVGVFVGLAITRALATIAPFRVRPMFETSIKQYPLSVPLTFNFVDWSSWPCDHAAYLGALAFGLALLSRRLTIPVMTYFAVWVCVPRLYLGIHYTSDVLTGTAIGIVTVWATLHIEEIRSFVANPILAFMEAKPQLFYTAAFLILFEMAMLFWDIQQPVHALLKTAGSSGHHRTALAVGLVLFASSCMSGIFIRRILMRRRSGLRGNAIPVSPVRTRSVHASHF
jgi:undecaprenyl-diphosphatase